MAKSVENAYLNLDPKKLENIYDQWERVLDLILKNYGGNDFVKRCQGKIKLDEIKESMLDKKDGILLGVDPDVEDESEDNTETEFDTDDDETKTELDTDDNDDDAGMGADADADSSDPSEPVAEAVAEFIVDGQCSVSFLELGILFTNDKTTQICVSFLSGNSGLEAEDSNCDK